MEGMHHSVALVGVGWVAMDRGFQALPGHKKYQREALGGCLRSMAGDWRSDRLCVGSLDSAMGGMDNE